jgi:hypothetical protein
MVRGAFCLGSRILKEVGRIVMYPCVRGTDRIYGLHPFCKEKIDVSL